jgi:HSP20 family protein
MGQEQKHGQQPPGREGQQRTEVAKTSGPAQGQGTRAIEPKPAPSSLQRRAESSSSSPFVAMRRLMDEMDRFFTGSIFGMPVSGVLSSMNPFESFQPSTWMPPIETLERDGRLVFRTELPGLSREDLRVEVIDDDLVISGERKQEEQQQNRRGAHYSERRYGSFERRFVLPEGCDPNTVQATYHDGILEVSIATPRRTPSARKTIEIGTGPHSSSEKTGPGSVH